MLCAPDQERINGWIKKRPFAVVRKLGRKRRVKRGFEPDDD